MGIDHAGKTQESIVVAESQQTDSKNKTCDASSALYH